MVGDRVAISHCYFRCSESSKVLEAHSIRPLLEVRLR